MKDGIDDALNSLLGKRRTNYSLKEIEAAQKNKKKNGGTILDNLNTVTGRSLPNINDQLAEFSRNLKEDFGAGVMETEAGRNFEERVRDTNEEARTLKGFAEKDATDGESLEKKAAEESTGEGKTEEAGIDSFNGLEEVIRSTVYGQDEFIHKLVIAFKRPFVMPPEGTKARNTIFITGPEDTGRHFALTNLVKEMNTRKLLASDNVAVINLALYTTSEDEKLFLQDIYSALNGKSSVILFENYESCHTSFLSRLSELVMSGSCRLSARYISQNGQLVAVTNGLASNTVGAIDAKGKYLVFISTKSVDKLAGSFGAPFVNALGDIAATKKLDDEALAKIAEDELKRLKEKANMQLSFNVENDDKFIGFSVKKAEKQAGLAGILSFFGKLYKSLAMLRLERDFAKDAKAALVTEEDTINVKIAEEVIDIDSILPNDYSGELETIKKEMEEIIGLEEVKKYIFSLEEYYRMQQRRREAGLKASEVSKHMIFTGNPGTGKTTIARIISRYLKAMGVLSGGQLVEVSRADLVGRYVGHTAPLTNQVIASAIGGVLFIDEAYSLYRGKDDSFGLEAIDTLVKGIEDNRDNLIVILAGYSKEMKEFLTANSGLKSRFPNLIDFPDYKAEQLLDITKSIAKSKGYVLDAGAEEKLLAYYEKVQSTRAADAGNGRLARNKVEEAILNQSRRLVAEKDADLTLLIDGDFDTES